MLLSIIIPSKGRQVTMNILVIELVRQIKKISLDDKIEIIIVDDGSEPALVKPSTNLASIKLIRQKNSGAPKAREKGLSISQGKFIHFHDSDDSVSDNWIESTTTYLTKNPSLDFLISRREEVHTSGRKYFRQNFLIKNKERQCKIIERLNYNNCFGPIGGVTFSRNILRNVKFRDIKSCQDWSMYLDALNLDSKIVEASDCYFIKNNSHDDQISHDIRKKVLGFLRLGREHKTLKNNLIRLYYVNSAIKKIPNHTHPLLKDFQRNKKLALWVSHIYVELIKLWSIIK